jgi:hypothetical protein
MHRACGKVMDKLFISRVQVTGLCAVSTGWSFDRSELYADSTVVELLSRSNIPALMNKSVICFLTLIHGFKGGLQMKQTLNKGLLI